MTLAGARGKTKAEMQKVLHLKDDKSIHDAFSDIVADIKVWIFFYYRSFFMIWNYVSFF